MGASRSPTENSEWATPSPDVMRLSSPGLRTTSLPRLSRCRISPAIGQVTVCRPVWGCGNTFMRGGRAEMIDEAPGTHGRQSAMGKGAVHRDAANPAKRDLPRIQ